MLCSIPNCSRAILAKGMCSLHYERVRRGISLEKPPRNPPLAPLRFIQEVASKDAPEECILWPYLLSGTGYPRLRFDGKGRSGTRYMCELRHGPAPSPSHQAAHSCGNPRCINHGHLRWATPKENTADKVGHGTQLRGTEIYIAKLNDEQVLSIKRRIRDGHNQEAMAREHGVTGATINSIKRGATWGWLKLEDAH